VGPPDRPRRADPPARGPCRGIAADPGALPRRAGRGARDAGPRPGVRGPHGDPRGTRGHERPRRSGRPLRARWDRPRRALAGRRPCPGRGVRRRQRGERRLDRAPRLVRGPALPPGGGRRGGGRGRAGLAGHPDRGPAQGRPSRQPDVDDRRARGRDAPRPGGGLGRGEEHVRAPIARGRRAAGGRRCRRPADRPGGDDRRGPRCRRHRGADRAPGTAPRGRGLPGGSPPGGPRRVRPPRRAPV
jgi:hypothetical protein